MSLIRQCFIKHPTFCNRSCAAMMASGPEQSYELSTFDSDDGSNSTKLKGVTIQLEYFDCFKLGLYPSKYV